MSHHLAAGFKKIFDAIVPTTAKPGDLFRSWQEETILIKADTHVALFEKDNHFIFLGITMKWIPKWNTQHMIIRYYWVEDESFVEDMYSLALWVELDIPERFHGQLLPVTE